MLGFYLITIIMWLIINFSVLVVCAIDIRANGWIESKYNKRYTLRKALLIFVCTWKDTVEKDDDYQDIIADVKNAVFDIVGTEIPFFEVSVKKYLDGKKKDKPVLVNKSGIAELKDYLEKATNYDICLSTWKYPFLEQSMHL